MKGQRFSTVRSILEKDPLSAATIELRCRTAMDAFGALLTGISKNYIPAFAYFAESRPLKYWNAATVKQSLELLERDPKRSFEALSTWNGDIDIAFANLMRLPEIHFHEERLDLNRSGDLILMSSGFHPEYLRLTEHIYGNLIPTLWGIQRKGGVNAQCVLKNAVADFERNGLEALTIGFNERIRNGISHGQVKFRGDGIQYGEDSVKYRLMPSEFLKEFDELWRTTNSIAISFLIFLGRACENFPENFRPSLSILSLLASSLVNDERLQFEGAAESEFRLPGKQLHIQLKTKHRGRVAHFLDCARVSYRLLELGISNYNRFVFQIDCGAKVSSMLGVLPNALENLVDENSTEERLPEIFDKDTMLLWTDESNLVRRLKVASTLFPAHLRLAKDTFMRELTGKGLFSSGKFSVRRVENKSTTQKFRIELKIVLQNSASAKDRDAVKEIIQTVIRSYRRRPMFPRKSSKGNQGPNVIGFPSYVWIHLYQLDGPLRWLESGGWNGGNLVAVAEFVSSKHDEPIFVKNPEEVWNGIRIRYSIDAAAASKAAADIQKLISDIHQTDSQ